MARSQALLRCHLPRGQAHLDVQRARWTSMPSAHLPLLRRHSPSAPNVDRRTDSKRVSPFSGRTRDRSAYARHRYSTYSAYRYRHSRARTGTELSTDATTQTGQRWLPKSTKGCVFAPTYHTLIPLAKLTGMVRRVIRTLPEENRRLPKGCLSIVRTRQDGCSTKRRYLQR